MRADSGLLRDLKPMAAYGDPAYPLRVRSRTEVLE